MYITHYMQMTIVIIQVAMYYIFNAYSVELIYYIITAPASIVLVYFSYFYVTFLMKNSKNKFSIISKTRKIKGVWSVSLGWFSMQLIWFISIGLDLIYVNFFFDKQQSIDFGILLKLAQGLSISLFFTMPLWPKLSEMLSKYGIKRSIGLFYKALTISAIVGIFSGLFLFYYAGDIAYFWLKSDSLYESDLVFIFSIWIAVFNIWCAVASFIGNKVFMRANIYACFIGGGAALLLKYPLLTLYGSMGVLASSVIGISISILFSLYVIIRMLGVENNQLTGVDYSKL
jgi:O-antigen/teichoic acid export membrane protein